MDGIHTMEQPALPGAVSQSARLQPNLTEKDITSCAHEQSIDSYTCRSKNYSFWATVAKAALCITLPVSAAEKTVF